jgi:hypothetical protein
VNELKEKGLQPIIHLIMEYEDRLEVEKAERKCIEWFCKRGFDILNIQKVPNQNKTYTKEEWIPNEIIPDLDLDNFDLDEYIEVRLAKAGPDPIDNFDLDEYIEKKRQQELDIKQLYKEIEDDANLFN